jgi:hypothetical protein
MAAEIVLDTCQGCGKEKLKARWQVQKLAADGLPSVIWDYCSIDCLVEDLAPRSAVD